MKKPNFRLDDVKTESKGSEPKILGEYFFRQGSNYNTDRTFCFWNICESFDCGCDQDCVVDNRIPCKKFGTPDDCHCDSTCGCDGDVYIP